MASDRDTLACLIADRRGDSANGIADAILAKGWCPPARVIQSVEELDALQSATAILAAWDKHEAPPQGAVIADASGNTMERDTLPGNACDEARDGAHAHWWVVGSSDYGQDSSTVEFPVTVLKEPEETNHD